MKIRFDAPRFAADLRAYLDKSPRGTRRKFEDLIPTSSLSLLLRGNEPRIGHVATICHQLSWDMAKYLTPRQRDWIIV